MLHKLLIMNKLEANDFSIKIGEHNHIAYAQTNSTFTFQRANFKDKHKIESRHCMIEVLRSIHIFKDTSSLEIFINNGEETFTSRIFDNIREQSISFHTNGSVNIDVKKWDVKRATW